MDQINKIVANYLMKFLKVMNIFYKRADFGFLLNCAYVLMKAVPRLSAGDFGL